jgi:hypothetical protein
MTDFDHWFDWYCRQNGVLPSEELRSRARTAYDTTYSCTCYACMYRKERGLIPVRLSKDCTLPRDIRIELGV